jgi:hypothetical protein
MTNLQKETFWAITELVERLEAEEERCRCENDQNRIGETLRNLARARALKVRLELGAK